MSEGLNDSWRGSSLSVPPSISPAFHSHLSPSADLGVAIFLTITGAVSVVGNGMVLLVHGRKRKKLRVHELMTINLAVCDFGYSLLGAPCLVISSLSHAWIFGDMGCLWYGIQGFVFGIGSLITTCLISLDRCFKICSVRYGQWIEKSHASLFIVLVWIYTLFWASLPAFGFGSYGPEPFGTSCTINWWRMKSSLNDRVYIFLILTLCFGIPTFTIITSYIAILITVYRSGRTLASIPSSAVTHSSKDLRLTKIAGVVCSTFLLAWTPYAIVSLYSALTAKEEQVGEHGTPGMSPGTLGVDAGHHGTGFPDFFGIHSLFNWTSPKNYSHSVNPGTSWRNHTTEPHSGSGFSSAPGSSHGSENNGFRAVSSLPPEVTLIPAMFAKSHCMINPFIYQIMNREFREDVYNVVCGKEGERRRGRGREGSDSDGKRSSITLSYCSSWRRRSTFNKHSSVERGIREKDSKKARSERGSWQDNVSTAWGSLDVATLDTQANLEREGGRSTTVLIQRLHPVKRRTIKPVRRLSHYITSKEVNCGRHRDSNIESDS
ncbi:opsin 9 [Chanos chanos]|uniref:Opsin 9 n=1 Tax=Chanos chanos TaxID=29144 RepID=A0A6J2WAE3_CHACN|nr:uncharacterized protein LOC115821667 [Chanos chanos]